MLSQDFISIINTLGVPVVVVNQKDYSIYHTNNSGEDFFGQITEKIKGDLIFDYLDEKGIEIIKAAFELLLNSEKGRALRENIVPMKRKSGRSLNANISISSFLIEGERYAIITIEDLSEVERLQEEQEKLKEEISQVSKLIDMGTLAAGMASELSSPLTVIQGFAENIELTLQEPGYSAEELLIQVDHIIQNSFRMGKIIEKMLGMARGEGAEIEDVAVDSLCDQVALSFKEIFHAHGIVSKINVQDDLFFAGDFVRAEQIITSIVNNAVSALEYQEDKKIEIEAKQESNSVTVKIWNNGPEIPEEIHQSLFTPFFTTKNMGEGLGLGLYLSKSMMNSLGGEISFESSKEKGTTFILKFKQALGLKTKMKVLVVEDEPFMRQIVCKKLSRLGVLTVSARSAAEGLTMLEKDKKIDAVFTDIKMPKMTGDEFVMKIRENGSSIPVVVLSGYADEREMMANKTLNLFGIVPKPIVDHDLAGVVSKLKDKVLGAIGSAA